MTTVYPCYAQADRRFASELAEFLTLGLSVRIFLDEGAITANENLIGKTRDGRMADVIAVILSPDSVPPKWERKDWEESFITGPASEGVRIAFLLRSECRFPEILRRHALFSDRRALKRWIRTGECSRAPTPPDLEALTTQIGDRPGMAASNLANEFVAECGSDFEAIFWLRCGDRTLAQLVGDLGWQMGLRLDGEPTVNAAAIRSFCEERRFLLVLEDVYTSHSRQLAIGGRASTLLTDRPVREYQPRGLEAIQQRFSASLSDDWPAVCNWARRAITLAREQSRFAEAFETMSFLYTAAETRGDRRVGEESAREQIWILEHWNRLEDADRMRYRLRQQSSSQMEFNFSDWSESQPD